ncbi:MAG: succinate dehydrogenase, hydrophobic membrane anchor protein [Kangiellaceae bacterium]|jgi:succinate dehydrogenase / fumarate reductase membrane anchor subunit|nr:succinate dehydrogenase, hydrophobic membrane anchor protein [Kangiellaceae bacterium]
MVTSATSLGRTGLHDWFIQRLSAVVMAIFAVYTAWFFIDTATVTHANLVAFFAAPFTKFFAIISIVLMSFHIWVGMWIISTDYIKPLFIRMAFQGALIVYCFALVLWGFQILWGV